MYTYKLYILCNERLNDQSPNNEYQLVDVAAYICSLLKPEFSE